MRPALARFGKAEEPSDQPRDRAAPDYCGRRRRRRAGRRASGERRSGAGGRFGERRAPALAH